MSRLQASNGPAVPRSLASSSSNGAYMLNHFIIGGFNTIESTSPKQLLVVQRHRRSVTAAATSPPLAAPRINKPRPPFAWLFGGASNNGDDPRFLAYLEKLAAEEAAYDARVAPGDGGSDAGGIGGSGAASSGKRTNEWYEDRCVFCAACRRAVNAEPGRRGARCGGCRRWFHGRCDPRRSDANGGDAADAASVRQSPFKCGSRACAERAAALRREAARGRRPLDPPDPSQQQQAFPFSGLLAGLFGGRSSKPAEQPDAPPPLTVRLIDLVDTRRQYRSLQRSGLLDARRRRALAAAGLGDGNGSGKGAVAKAAASGSGSGDEDEADKGSRAAAAAPAGSALDDFLVAAALIRAQHADVESEDVLEDSYAALLARGRTPLSAASLNAYATSGGGDGGDGGAGHARLQCLVTAPAERRRGHARALLAELHAALARAGLERVVAVMAEDTAEARAARDRLFFAHRLSYAPLDPAEAVALRRALPDYHPALLRGAQLIAAPLAPWRGASASGGGGARAP